VAQGGGTEPSNADRALLDVEHEVGGPPPAGDRRFEKGFRPGVRLGVDVGDVRIGVARSDPSGLLATPVETVRRGAGDLAR
jgi:hypothetical protein